MAVWTLGAPEGAAWLVAGLAEQRLQASGDVV